MMNYDEECKAEDMLVLRLYKRRLEDICYRGRDKLPAYMQTYHQDMVTIASNHEYRQYVHDGKFYADRLWGGAREAYVAEPTSYGFDWERTERVPQGAVQWKP